MIDINRKDLYELGNPNSEKRTKNRLIEIKEIGMTEVNIAEFGIKGIMSGLFVENIWHYDDKEWIDYINWVKTLKNK